MLKFGQSWLADDLDMSLFLGDGLFQLSWMQVGGSYIGAYIHEELRKSLHDPMGPNRILDTKGPVSENEPFGIGLSGLAWPSYFH